MTVFDSTIQGIPCRIKVTHYSPYRDNRVGHPDHWLPDDPEEFEFEVLDQKGYPAPWLADKLTEDDEVRLLNEYLND